MSLQDRSEIGPVLHPLSRLGARLRARLKLITGDRAEQGNDESPDGHYRAHLSVPRSMSVQSLKFINLAATNTHLLCQLTQSAVHIRWRLRRSWVGRCDGVRI